MRPRVAAVLVLVASALSADRSAARTQEPDGAAGLREATTEDIILGQRVRMQSASFGTERTVLVHLPDGYEGSEDQYPVLMVVGGDYFLPAAGVATYLAGDSRMPEVIVVAVPIEDWVAEFTYTPTRDTAAFYATAGGADQLQRFLSDEVIPYIDATYRVLPLRILVGHSLGGLFAVETMTRYPELFQVTIAISPSLFYNDGDWVERLPAYLQNARSREQVLYLALANETAIPPYMERAVELLGRHAPRGVSFAFEHSPKESHVSVALPALVQGLRSAFAGWSFGDVEMWTLGAEGIRAHFDSLRTRLGVDIPLPRNEIIAHGFHAMERHQEVDAAIEMFLLAVSLDDGSADAHAGLAEAYQRKGMREEAVEHCRRRLAIDPEHEQARALLAALEG